MRRLHAFLGLAGAFSLAAVGPLLTVNTAACSKDAVPPSSQNPINIGLSVGLTGSYSGTAVGIKQGALAAANIINARGGVLGRALNVIVRDDQSTTSGRLGQVITEFINTPVSAIVGPGSTTQVEYATGLVYPEGAGKQLDPTLKHTLLVSAWSTSPKLSTEWLPWPNRFLYRTPPTDYYQRVALWRRMTDPVVPAGSDAGAPSCQRPFLIWANDALGGTYHDFFATKVGAQYMSAGVDSKVASDYTDTVINPIKALTGSAAPDCYAFVTYADVSANIMNQMDTAGLFSHGQKLFGTDAGFDDVLLQTVARPALLEGLQGVEPDTEPGTTAFREFRDIFQSQTATSGDGGLTSPPPYSSNAFDAMVLVAFGIERAGDSTDPVKIRDAMIEVSRGYPANSSGPSKGTIVTPGAIGAGLDYLINKQVINYQGASGNVDFDQNGDVSGGYVKWYIQNGAFHTLDGDGSRYTSDDLVPLEPAQ